MEDISMFAVGLHLLQSLLLSHTEVETDENVLLSIHPNIL